jgi:DNA mismatch endonuclease (patch repair protein)
MRKKHRRLILSTRPLNAGSSLVPGLAAGHSATSTVRYNMRNQRLAEVSVDTFTPEKRSKVMAAIHGRNTAPEMHIRTMLHRIGYRYRLHYKNLPGTPDLVFPGRKCVIFVHGCFWHGHTCRRAALPATNVSFWSEKIGKNRQRDERTVCVLQAEGWRVLIVWQCEMKDVMDLQANLTQFLGPTDRNRREDQAKCSIS